MVHVTLLETAALDVLINRNKHCSDLGSRTPTSRSQRGKGNSDLHNSTLIKETIHWYRIHKFYYLQKLNGGLQCGTSGLYSKYFTICLKNPMT